MPSSAAHTVSYGIPTIVANRLAAIVVASSCSKKRHAEYRKRRMNTNDFGCLGRTH